MYKGSTSTACYQGCSYCTWIGNSGTHVQLRDDTVLYAVRAGAGYSTSTLLRLRGFTRPAVGGLNRDLRLHLMQGHFVVILHVLRRSQQPSKHTVPYPYSTCCTVPRTRTVSACVLAHATVHAAVQVRVRNMDSHPLGPGCTQSTGWDQRLPPRVSER
jgi:hypothetical protein